MTSKEIIDFYRQPGTMTALGMHAGRFAVLAGDVASIADAVHGLYIHEHIAGAYGVEISDERRPEVHIRSNLERVKCLLARDSRPLNEPRPLGERMVANCRHYSTFTVAGLREHGIPARARCGFGTYFSPGWGVDHWVVEYWNGERWVMADAQLDAFQRERFGIDWNVLDMPAGRFIVAGEAWKRCRNGEADPEKFGILDMAGLWFIAGNLIRDVASLNKMEMLPWDSWGAMAQPGEEIAAERMALFDRLAEMTVHPDECFAELQAAYESDALRVPSVVFNAVHGRPEAV